MQAPDLTLLIEAAKASGEIAAKYWKRSPEIWDKPDQAGPVTEADLKVDRMLHTELRAARPDYGWLSEETEDTTDRLNRDYVFIIDPIDGTRAFIAGSPAFSHSLAVAHKGQVIAAVVYLPMLDRMYTASSMDPAMKNHALIAASQKDHLQDATILAAKSNFAPDRWPRGVPPVQQHFRSSLAYRLSLIAEGRFDGMITLRNTWEWDVAAGSLIAEKAGACVSQQDGNIPQFNNPQPMLNGLIAAAPAVHAGLRQRLS